MVAQEARMGYSGYDYDYESFITAVEKGLKFINPKSKSKSKSKSQIGEASSSYSPALLPTSPVVYASVPDTLDPSTTAFVPLQIGLVAVKLFALANPNPNPNSSSSVRVRFKASWLLDTQFSNSPLFLALPVGFKGTLISYETKLSYFSQSSLQKVELYGNYKPQLQQQNLYLVSLPPVEVRQKDMEICIIANYVQEFSKIDYEQGLYSFTVPLSIPSYVTQSSKRILRTQKIRLILECKGDGIIVDSDITSHAMIDITTDKTRRVFLQESRSYSDKDLTCSFRVKDVSD